ncbi:MAG: hypothetical protein ATN36_05570 [Epulopiscium sp. Nele67-Bin005]|nr:MAG: hypothetical protein ATN36_05570 [Epulopiscium sp. Nele67-Bin005]
MRKLLMCIMVFILYGIYKFFSPNQVVDNHIQVVQPIGNYRISKVTPKEINLENIIMNLEKNIDSDVFELVEYSYIEKVSIKYKNPPIMYNNLPINISMTYGKQLYSYKETTITKEDYHHVYYKEPIIGVWLNDECVYFTLEGEIVGVNDNWSFSPYIEGYAIKFFEIMRDLIST